MCEFDYWPDADAAMDAMEADPTMRAVLEDVERTLDRLSADPCDRRLGTTVFQSPELGGVSATPTRLGDWYVFWQRSAEPGVLEVVLIHELTAVRPS